MARKMIVVNRTLTSVQSDTLTTVKLRLTAAIAVWHVACLHQLTNLKTMRLSMLLKNANAVSPSTLHVGTELLSVCSHRRSRTRGLR